MPLATEHFRRAGNPTLLDQIGAPMAVRLNRLGHAEAQTTMGCTQSRQTNAELQMNLGKLCTLMHGMNQKGVRATNALTLRVQ